MKLFLLFLVIASSTAAEDVLKALARGPAVVKIKKASGVGAGYYLIAHSDRRNSQSVWALSHRDRPTDQEDQKWNVLVDSVDGQQCFKLQKAVQRNGGLMLTAHSNERENGNIRTLVHSQNHNIPDECWSFHSRGDNIFRIVKAMNRNKGMHLVNSEGRNSESYWVDLSSTNDDFLWEVEFVSPLVLPATLAPQSIMIEALNEGSAVVKIKKASGVGAGYYLIAHSDRRNSQSVWALSHRDRPTDQEDQKWNVLVDSVDGQQCFKLQKAVQRNGGLMLTAHSNERENGNVRTLVHSQNHNIPDECWIFTPQGGDNFKIAKALNRNKGMYLVNGEQRNSESYWVDLSSTSDDFLWEIQLQ